MGKFRLSLKARIDVNNIWEYTFNKWSLKQADAYFVALQNQFEIIADNPSFGKNYDFLREHYYGMKFKSHIIFYRFISSAEVEIVRVLHEKMDFPNRLIE